LGKTKRNSIPSLTFLADSLGVANPARLASPQAYGTDDIASSADNPRQMEDPTNCPPKRLPPVKICGDILGLVVRARLVAPLDKTLKNLGKPFVWHRLWAGRAFDGCRLK
jgi:hypothetical protein